MLSLNRLTILFILALCIGSTSITAQENMWSEISHFFESYTKDGKVNYSKIKQEGIPDLSVLTDWIANTSPQVLEQKSLHWKKSFYLNAYNILVVQSVMDDFPISSPLDVPGFFSGRKHLVAGKKMTLEALEKKYLFEQFPDARLHFALICAADGCPPIADYAFQADQLDQQLDQQTRKALDDPSFLNVDAENQQVNLSQIFVWYASDFRKESKNVKAFINQYRSEALPEAYSIRYEPYDWSLNNTSETEASSNKSIPIQSYTPSVLLRPRQVEFKSFLNLYTQRHFFDEGRQLVWADERATFFTGIFQLQMGLSNTFNVGIDLYFRSATFRDPETSATDVFAFLNNPEHRTALTQIGPKFRYAPFKTPGLTMQSTLLFPTAKQLQGIENEDDESQNRPFLDHDGYQVFHSFLYDRPISARFRFYGDLGFWLRLDRNFRGENTGITIPMKVFLTYFANPRTSFYGMTDFGPNLGSGYYLQSGLGVKTQLSAHFELEFLYTNFWTGQVSGGGYTLNLGGRFVY